MCKKALSQGAFFVFTFLISAYVLADRSGTACNLHEFDQIVTVAHIYDGDTFRTDTGEKSGSSVLTHLNSRMVIIPNNHWPKRHTLHCLICLPHRISGSGCILIRTGTTGTNACWRMSISRMEQMCSNIFLNKGLQLI